MLAVLFLGACAGELSTPSEALRLLTTQLPPAIVGEPYSAQLQVTGGLRPYELTLERGVLPAGLRLEGGSIRGTPTQTGETTFTVLVSDANLSQFTSEFELRVVTAPPTALSLRPPETEVRGRVTLRARVSEARALRGLSTLITWDAEAYQLQADSLTASHRGLALLHDSGPGWLQVDLAVLAGQGPGGSSEVSGAADLFSFALEPLAGPAQVAVRSTTRFASIAADGHRFEHAVLVEGGPAARSALQAAAGSTATAEQEPGDDEEPPSDTEPGDDVDDTRPPGPTDPQEPADDEDDGE